MSKKPILFNSEMVRAILAGTKTQTRRTAGLEDVNEHPEAWERVVLGDLAYMAKKRARGKYGATFQSKPGALEPRTISICPTICPYGRPGGLLWVREAWATMPQWDNVKPSDLPVNGASIYYCDDAFGEFKKRPSIFMPRWASRITLQVTAVRVERLQDISEADVLAEGADPLFHVLWDSINAKRGYGWETNPFVWVVEFEVVNHA